MQTGDLLHIHGQNDNETFDEWYGELVGINEDGNLEVFLLEKTNLCGGFVWSYRSEWA